LRLTGAAALFRSATGQSPALGAKMDNAVRWKKAREDIDFLIGE